MLIKDVIESQTSEHTGSHHLVQEEETVIHSESPLCPSIIPSETTTALNFVFTIPLIFFMGYPFKNSYVFLYVSELYINEIIVYVFCDLSF